MVLLRATVYDPGFVAILQCRNTYYPVDGDHGLTDTDSMWLGFVAILASKHTLDGDHGLTGEIMDWDTIVHYSWKAPRLWEEVFVTVPWADVPLLRYCDWRRSLVWIPYMRCVRWTKLCNSNLRLHHSCRRLHNFCRRLHYSCSLL